METKNCLKTFVSITNGFYGKKYPISEIFVFGIILEM